MTVIQIKRSTGSTAPTTSDLAEGELAYAEDRSGSGANAILYIESVASDGTTATIDKIGGKYYTNTVDSFLDPRDGTVGDAVVLKDADGSNTVTLMVCNDIHFPIVQPAVFSNNRIQLEVMVGRFGIVATLFMSRFSLNKIGGMSNIYIGNGGIFARNLVKKRIRIVNI